MPATGSTDALSIISRAMPTSTTGAGTTDCAPDAKSEQSLLAISTLLGEHAFHSTAANRVAGHREPRPDPTAPDPDNGETAEAPLLRWARAIHRAIGRSQADIARLDGRTLILVDTSGSMIDRFNDDGSIELGDAAAVFGLALGSRCEAADIVSFSSAHADGPGSKVFDLQRAESLPQAVQRWTTDGFFLCYGTDVPGALRAHFRDHHRVVILSDGEPWWGGAAEVFASSTPLYIWDVATQGHILSGGRNRSVVSGVSDEGFIRVPVLGTTTHCPDNMSRAEGKELMQYRVTLVRRIEQTLTVEATCPAQAVRSAMDKNDLPDRRDNVEATGRVEASAIATGEGEPIWHSDHSDDQSWMQLNRNRYYLGSINGEDPGFFCIDAEGRVRHWNALLAREMPTAMTADVLTAVRSELCADCVPVAFRTSGGE